MIGWAGGRAWFIVYGVILTPATVTPGLGHRDNEANVIWLTYEENEVPDDHTGSFLKYIIFMFTDRVVV